MHLFGLYESASIWRAERYAPATDGFALIEMLSPSNPFETLDVIACFEQQHRRFVTELPRPHKLSLHLGLSFHPVHLLNALSRPGPGEGLMRHCGTQGLLAPTCLLQDWAVEEVVSAADTALSTLIECDELAVVNRAEESALLRLSVHVFDEQLQGELQACTFRTAPAPGVEREAAGCAS